MFHNYLKFNIKLTPVYLFFTLILIFGTALTGDNETYVSDMSAVIAQIVGLLLIPNLVYMFRHRKKADSLLGLIRIFPLIALPFILIAILMRIFYL